MGGAWALLGAGETNKGRCLGGKSISPGPGTSLGFMTLLTMVLGVCTDS